MQKIIVSLLIIAFLMPIGLYAYKFGFGIWDEHSKWAEMGSAFSGIYSPLIAFLAFLVLAVQVKSQNSINKHQYDQVQISESREALNFYITRLDLYLDEEINGGQCVRLLLKRFSVLSQNELESQQGRDFCFEFALKHRKVFDIWLAIYPFLIGLSSVDEFPYTHNYKSALLKISTVLSLDTCVALDKVYFGASPNIKRHELKFWLEGNI